MIIALPHKNGIVDVNFARTGQFMIYEIDGNQIVSSRIFFTHGQGAKGLATLLAEQNVEMVLCNSAGKAGKMALDDECIEVVEGLEGAVEEVTLKYLNLVK